MPGLASDPGDDMSLIPFPSETPNLVIYPLHHGLKPPISPRLSISWSRGNTLRVSVFRLSGSEVVAEGGDSDCEVGGKVVEVKLGTGDGEINEVQWRKIAYGSVSPFAMLQSRKNSMSALSKMSMDSSPYSSEWMCIVEVLEVANAKIGLHSCVKLSLYILVINVKAVVTSQLVQRKYEELDECSMIKKDLEVKDPSRRARIYAFYVQKDLKIKVSNVLERTVTLSETIRWEYVMEYSKEISSLLCNPKLPPTSVIEDPKTVLEKFEVPTCLKAAWELMEIFYTDKQAQAWLPERLIDWLADYDSLFSGTLPTVHSKLVDFQNKLLTLQAVEDDPKYWEAITSALAVGWLEIVVKLLRLHGSYQFDQLGNREVSKNPLVVH
ncbi:unnamed protein product [Ilex paraguariensis]|uniref:Nuclear pore complex protein Nup85 n=1 Tax=Ilex paraguariensis TaxID=185542 RepID=A0ABC8UV36_9AQUA